MKNLDIIVLLVIVFSNAVPAIGEQNAPVDLQEAREQGRVNSRFLKNAELVAGTEGTNDERPAASAVGLDGGTIPTANVESFRESIGPVLVKSCLACHGPENTEGRLRVDQLNPNLLTGADIGQWREIYNALSNSEMPPEDDSGNDLSDADRAMIVDWLSDELRKASVVRRNNHEHSSFRRLTKYEFNYALQDLLGLPYTLASELPSETASEDGFKNSSQLLQMSAMQFESYRDISRRALKRATVSGERPQPVRYIVSMQDEMEKVVAADNEKVFDEGSENYSKERRRQHLFNRETGQGIHFSRGAWKPTTETASKAIGEQTPEVSPVVLAIPRSNELKMNLDRFLPDDGIMRVRIRAGRSTMNPNEYASLRLSFSAHTSNNANFHNVISQQDIPVTASADAPEFIHFDIPLSDIQRNPFRKLETRFPRRDEFLHVRNIANTNGQDHSFQVLIDTIEITAPHYQQWPPETHTSIFFDSPHRSDEQKYGREVLDRFLKRIWRRTAKKQEIDQFMVLFAEYRPEFASFEDTMVEVLATALATPEFLYLTQRIAAESERSSRSIRDAELASRLAIFLWASIPDQELLQLAEESKLHEPGTLTAQVDRMLADPRAKRFSEQFVQQWLGIDGLDSVAHVTDQELKAAMREEPVAFFDEVLKNNLSVMDFIHSDYAVVNERLARHFGIRDVYGPHFRSVPIEPGRHRGGLLTGAAVLTMNSDGKDSHPLKRGVWMLERILHDPPPPPPPNVPEVDLTDPEILKMTLKERIADHRNKAACRSCHSRIDPWGIAFENYDAMGSFRTRIKDKPVDANAQLFNKQTLAGMDGLKQYLLLQRQDQFARAMVHKMMAYALGRPLSFADHAEIEDLTREFRNRGDRLGDLVHLMIGSDLFRSNVQ